MGLVEDDPDVSCSTDGGDALEGDSNVDSVVPVVPAFLITSLKAASSASTESGSCCASAACSSAGVSSVLSSVSFSLD